MSRGFAMVFLLGIGTVWGLGVPIWKIASSGPAHPFALLTWQVVIIVVALGPAHVLTRTAVPFDRASILFYGVLGMTGTVVSGVLYVLAVRELPAGIMVITVSTVPMFTLLLATLLRLDTPTVRRLLGIVLGLVAILILFSPSALPDPSSAPYLLLGLLTALLYSIEGNWIALRMPAGMSAFTALFGGALTMTALLLPLSLWQGSWVDPTGPWEGWKWALLAGCVLHLIAYTGYVWLVGRTGPVFASLVGYVVTLTGVLWSAVLLEERYSVLVWIAFAIMFTGLLLVQPKAGKPESA